MLTGISNDLAVSLMRGFRFGGGRGNTELVLVLIGLGFAGLLVWAIQRSGKSAS